MFHVINEIIIRLDVVESYQDYVVVYTENTKLDNEYPFLCVFVKQMWL